MPETTRPDQGNDEREPDGSGRSKAPSSSSSEQSADSSGQLDPEQSIAGEEDPGSSLDIVVRRENGVREAD